MSQTSTSFEHDATATLQELRQALTGVLEHLKPPVGRATDLGRLLQLDNRLSWRIYNAATAGDALAIAPLIPGERAMERFLSAAATRGVPDADIERARAAFERFEDAVHRHARTRDVFAAMVGTLGDEGNSAGDDERHKREAFRHTSILVGREARAGLAVHAFHPSAKAGMLDAVQIAGTIGLHRTRGESPLVTIVQHGRDSTRPDAEEGLMQEPLEGGDPADGPVGLLREFCSQPVPKFQFKGIHRGTASYELVPTGRGASSEVTFMTGQVLRACSLVPGSTSESELDAMRLVTMPLEVSIQDVMIHESVWDERLPQVIVYYAQASGSVGNLDEPDVLPLTERVAYLGRGVDPGRTPLVPRYAELLSYALGRVGWKAEEMRLFRCRVNYPLLSSAIELRFRREPPLKATGEQSRT